MTPTAMFAVRVRADGHDESIEWPTVDPEEARPSLDIMRRVLDGLRRR